MNANLTSNDAADPEQVFLPYAITPTGETLYEVIKRNSFEQLALPATTQA
jgi:hypothetical protein